MHTNAIRIHKFGGPEVLSWERVELQAPGPTELLISNVAVGVNFVDIHHREGTYHSEFVLPATLGVEGSGVVEQVGSDVEGFVPGDRVAYFGPPFGSYAERRLYPAARTVKLPPEIDHTIAAAVLLKGVTAYYLAHLAHPIKHGEIVLIHGAAGGVGIILSQWAAALGATVIGAVSSEEKARIAKHNGCEHVIVTSREEVPARVRDLTGGQMASVVYDPIGKDTFLSSVDCLRARGMLVSYGFKSGHIPPIDSNLLMKKGSLVFTRTTNKDFTGTPHQLLNATSALFRALGSGVITPLLHGTYALRDVAQAHTDIEARKTSGSVVLTVAEE